MKILIIVIVFFASLNLFSQGRTQIAHVEGGMLIEDINHGTLIAAFASEFGFSIEKVRYKKRQDGSWVMYVATPLLSDTTYREYYWNLDQIGSGLFSTNMMSDNRTITCTHTNCEDCNVDCDNCIGGVNDERPPTCILSRNYLGGILYIYKQQTDGHIGSFY